MELQRQKNEGKDPRDADQVAVSSETVDLSCPQRLDRARAYVLLMRDLRRSAWRSPDDGSVAAG